MIFLAGMDNRHPSIIVGFRCHQNRVCQVFEDGYQVLSPNMVRGFVWILDQNPPLLVGLLGKHPCPLVELRHLVFPLAQHDPHQRLQRDLAGGEVGSFCVFI